MSAPTLTCVSCDTLKASFCITLQLQGGLVCTKVVIMVYYYFRGVRAQHTDNEYTACFASSDDSLLYQLFYYCIGK